MSGGLRRDSLDAIFSTLVRERAGWQSELSRSGGSLQCCHIYSRKFLSTRWHPLNAVCLTASEHAIFTDRPISFANFCNAKFGPDKMHQLAILANTPRKFTPRERAGLLKFYRGELQRIKTARENGRVGRIEFEWPDPIPEGEPRAKKKKPKSKFKKKLNGEVVLRSQP
jgi:hypothetical protein